MQLAAGQALVEFGANERHQASLDLSKWAAEQPYKRATVADRLQARSNMLANLAGLGGGRNSRSDTRQQLGAAFLSQAGQLAASRGDRFGPILSDMGNLRGLSARSQAAGAQLMDGLEGVQGSPSPALPGALPAPQLSRTAAATPVAASMAPVSGQAPVIAQTANFSDEVLRLLEEDDRRNGQQPGQKPAPG
jgi:hypothetical protein